ncbi:MAG: anti-sigma-D factor RsdA, partial [Mycobacterium sp.]|nr:anti-sigma-D factor RsdA [Mycobacterium sp.]
MPDFGRWTANGGDPSINEINRSDQFLDALASQQPAYSTDHGEAELASLLAGWRDDVRETPMAELVSVDEAARVLDGATSPGRRRRLSLAVVGSAAAAVLCLGGFGAVVAGAGPGDALYGLRSMLFGEQATLRDDAVILAAQTEMAEVQQLIDQGDWQAAQDKLETITTTVATVDDVASKQELVTQWQELTVKVEAQDAAATPPPGAPLPTFPEIPVVNLDPGTLITDTSVTSEPATSSPEVTSSESPTPSTSETTAPSTSTTSETSTSPTATTSETEPSATPSATTTQSPAPTTTSSATTSSSVISQSSASATSSVAAEPSPTSEASPTVTRQPTSTPIPTPTPRTTATPIPTPTVEPSPTPAAPLPTTTTLVVLPETPGEPS